MHRMMGEEKKELDELKEELVENEKQQIGLFKEANVIKMAIKKVEEEINKKSDCEVQELVGKVDMIIKSGEFEAMTR